MTQLKIKEENMSILPSADFARRIEAAREVVRQNNLDAVLVFSTECEPAAVRYFSGIRPNAYGSALIAAVHSSGVSISTGYM